MRTMAGDLQPRRAYPSAAASKAALKIATLKSQSGETGARDLSKW